MGLADLIVNDNLAAGGRKGKGQPRKSGILEARAQDQSLTVAAAAEGNEDLIAPVLSGEPKTGPASKEAPSQVLFLHIRGRYLQEMQESIEDLHTDAGAIHPHITGHFWRKGAIVQLPSCRITNSGSYALMIR